MRAQTMVSLPLWISWISLVSAQCTNLAQFGYLGRAPVVPTGLFDSGCVGSGCSFTTAGVGCGRSSTCLRADTIPFPLSVLNCNQPTYTRVVANTTENQKIDNICNVFERVPGAKTYTISSTTVYVDGTFQTRTSLMTDVEGGNYVRATDDISVTTRILGKIGDDTIVDCSLVEFGDVSKSRPLAASTIGSRKPLSLSVVQQIQNIFDCNGLGSCQSLYVLPYRLPSQCIWSRIPINIISNNPGGFFGGI